MASVTHACPICSRADRNKKTEKDPWSYIYGCMEHLHNGASCLDSLLNADSPDTTGASLTPSTAELLSLKSALETFCLFRPFSIWDLVVIDSGLLGSIRYWRGFLFLAILQSLPEWRPFFSGEGKSPA